MITKNLSTLKIHKLTQEQYDRELAAGNLDDTAIYLTTDNTQEQLDTKVDKIEGMGLSTNDFTNDLLSKLNSIETGAEVNVQSDWNQNDETSADYVKNRTHSVRYEREIVFSESDIYVNAAGEYIIVTDFIMFDGDIYALSINGVETLYTARTIHINNDSILFAGDHKF